MGDLGLDAGNQEKKKNASEGIRDSLPQFCHTFRKCLIPIEETDTYRSSLQSRNRPAPSLPRRRKRSLGSIHPIATTLLENLSDSLGLHSNERFEVYHKANRSSTSTACLQYYPFKDLPPNTSVGHFTHTDTGSITVLFNSDWGLQVFSPACHAWEYVAPRPDCAIVNVGDALKFISGFRLKSSLDRVVSWNGTWTKSPRYATIFFLRPNDNTEFVDSEGVRWTAAAWLRRKFQNYRFPHKQQETNAISTGRKGFSGLVEMALEPAASS